VQPQTERARSVKLALLLALLALGMGAYYYCNPFRRRDVRDTGYLTEPLEFSEADVGGPGGADDILVAIFSVDDPLCNWLEQALLAADPQLFPASFAVLTPRSIVKDRQERSDALVALLNRLARREVAIPAGVMYTTGLAISYGVSMRRLPVGADTWDAG